MLESHIEGKDEKGRDPLFAVAFKGYIQATKSWTVDFKYLHAEDSNHARMQFCYANQGKKFEIIGVAPVIGYFALDDNGDNVTVQKGTMTMQRSKIMLVVSKIGYALDTVKPETFALFVEFVENAIDSKDPNKYIYDGMKKALGK